MYWILAKRCSLACVQMSKSLVFVMKCSLAFVQMRMKTYWIEFIALCFFMSSWFGHICLFLTNRSVHSAQRLTCSLRNGVTFPLFLAGISIAPPRYIYFRINASALVLCICLSHYFILSNHLQSPLYNFLATSEVRLFTVLLQSNYTFFPFVVSLNRIMFLSYSWMLWHMTKESCLARKIVIQPKFLRPEANLVIL